MKIVILHDGIKTTQKGVFVFSLNNKILFLFKKTNKTLFFLKQENPGGLFFLEKTGFSQPRKMHTQNALIRLHRCADKLWNYWVCF